VSELPLVSEPPLVDEGEDFFFVVSFVVSMELVPEEPEESVVPDMVEPPDEPEVPDVMPEVLDESVEPEPVLELWAMETPVPSAEIRTAIKSFFMDCLH
jgi:hypothetical protein